MDHKFYNHKTRTREELVERGLVCFCGHWFLKEVY